MSDVLDARAKAMVATVEAKTGKTVADYVKLAKAKGLDDPATKPGALIAWLKADHGLGHGHAMAMTHAIRMASRG